MTNLLFDLTGRVALVTGSYQGLGLAIARGLGVAGATVVLNGRNKGKLREGVAELSGEGLQVTGCCFDVSKAGQIQQEIPVLESEVGPIDILVNNAGIQRRSPLERFEVSVWQEVLDINLTGVFLVTHQVVQGMIARKSGKIINICSLMCEMARPTVGAYAAAKGGGEDAHQGDGRRVGEAQHSDQRHWARILRHRDEPAVEGGSEFRCLGSVANTGR